LPSGHEFARLVHVSRMAHFGLPLLALLQGDSHLVLVLSPLMSLDEKRHSQAASRGLRSMMQSALSVRTFLLVCGGLDALSAASNVEVFDPKHDRWSLMPSLVQPRAWAVSAVMHGCVYVLGGVSASAKPLTSAERFDPEAEHWEVLPSMRTGRIWAFAAACGGSLYVCGGMNPTVNSVERFDGCRWEGAPAMGTRRAGAAGCLFGETLFVCGGYDDSNGVRENLRSVETFEDGGWRVAPPMSRERLGAGAAALGDRLYVCGGESSRHDSSVESLSASRVWEVLPPMRVPRFRAFAAAVAGRLMMFGGQSDAVFETSSECLDPEVGWQPFRDSWRCRLGASCVAWRCSDELATTLKVLGKDDS